VKKAAQATPRRVVTLTGNSSSKSATESINKPSVQSSVQSSKEITSDQFGNKIGHIFLDFFKRDKTGGVQ
jgi:hypothetical protein